MELSDNTINICSNKDGQTMKKDQIVLHIINLQTQLRN